ncbi:MAG TPA: sensor histidine kinase [Flavisolibacter sp.]|nr:sensor histidine kinase [Flavisolibacter sp.]
MLQKLLLIFLLPLSVTVQAQGNTLRPVDALHVRKQIDSLKKELQQRKLDPGWINTELALANNYTYISTDTASYFAEHALNASKKISYTDGEILAIKTKGILQETAFKNYASALFYYNQALSIAKMKSRDSYVHDLYNAILNLYFYLGDFVKAMKIASERLMEAQKRGDKWRIAHYNSTIGFIHLRQNNTAGAAAYYNKYLSLSYRLRDSLLIADALNCFAEVLLAEKKYDEALTHFTQAFNIYQRLYSRNELIYPDRIPYTFFKLGFAYGAKNDLRQALYYVGKAVKFSKKISCNLYDVAQYYIYAGGLYKRIRDFNEAYHMLYYGLALAKRIHHKESLRDGYFHLHQLFSTNKKFDSAYHYYSLYEQLKDSIVNESTRREIDRLGTSYMLQEKDHAIKLLNQQKKVQEIQLKRQLLVRNLAIAFSVLLVLIVVLIVNRNYLRKKNRLQEEINLKQNEMFNTVSTIQDQERKRIAQDLHDGMGTLLSAAKLKLSNLRVTQEVRQVQDTVCLLDEAIAELRFISHNIMPAPLSRLGLVAALQNLFSRLTESVPLQFEFVSHGFNERIPEEKEILIYRMVLELVNNIIKHADAKRISVQLVKYPNEINIIVEDDGKGFDEQKLHAPGLGLSGVRSRVAYMQGSCHFDSADGSGTTAIINLPL